MKLIKKQIDFSRGEINPLLTERTDLNILDKTAKYIKNFYPTIFGTLKNRKGTRKIEMLQDIGGKIENPTITNNINDTGNYFDDTKFISNIIGNETNFFNFIANDELNKIKNFSIQNIYLQEAQKLTIEYENELIIPITPPDLYEISSIDIDIKTEYEKEPIILFNIEGFNPNLEILPIAECIIDQEGNLIDINIINNGSILDISKLTATIQGDNLKVVSFTSQLKEKIIENEYYKLTKINIINSGNNYSVAPDINFIINSQLENEILPILKTNLDNNNQVASVEILDGGKIYNLDGGLDRLSYTIDDPQGFNETLKVETSTDNINFENKFTFEINSQENNIMVELDNYYQYIRINRVNDNFLNTKLIFDKFIFSISDPEIISSVGGDINDLLTDTGNFKTEPLGGYSGELLKFIFPEKVNIFSLNNVKISSGNEAKFVVNVFYQNLRDKKTHTTKDPDYRSITTTFISSISIVEAGLGYKPNTTYNLIFVPNVGPGGVMPIVRATTNSSGSFEKIQLINNAYYQAIGGWSSNSNPPALFTTPTYEIFINDAEYFDIQIVLQGKNQNSNEWEDITKYNVNKISSQNIFANVSDFNYKEFRIIREDSNNYNINLEISSYSASGNLPIPAKNIKLVPFEYKEEYYIIALCNGYIEIFKNDKLLTILKCSKLKSEIIQDIKFAQYDNRIILVHADLLPQEIKIDKETNIFTINDFYLLNIPFATFNGEITKIIDSYLILTPSDSDGTITLTANYDFFTGEMINQYIDSNSVAGGKCRIIKFETAKKVIAETIIPFYNKNSFNNFWLVSGYEKVWSEEKGYPTTCLFYQNRLWFGGSKNKQFSLWASRINNFNDFNNIYNNDNEAIAIDILSKEYEEIKHIIANKGLQIFTDKNEYLASEQSLTPNGIIVSKVSSVGIDKNINPVIVLGDTLFIDKNKKALNKLTNTNYEDSIAVVKTSVVSILNSNLIKEPIAISLDYSNIDGDGNFLYIVNNDGTITIGNILLEETISSFTRFEFNNAKIKDVLLSNNKIYFVIERNGLLYLEIYDKNLLTDFSRKANIVKNDINKEIIIENLFDYEDNDIMIYTDDLKFNYRVRVDNGKAIIKYEDLDDKLDSIPEIVNLGFVVDCELYSNDIIINQETNTRLKRIASAEITTTTDSKGFNFNNSYLENPIKLNEDFLFKKQGASNWNEKVFFRIMNDFGNLEIKSIVLIVNV